MENQTKKNNFIASELRYRRLFETAQDGVLLIDFETGMIMDVNPFLIKMLGYSKSNFLKKHLWEVGVFKDIAASKENFETLRKKRFVRFEDLPLESKSGNKIDVEFVANAYSVGSETIIQCNIRDITDRKRAENLVKRSEVYLRATLDSTSDGILVIDDKGKIINANARFIEFWKIPKELVRKGDDKLLLSHVAEQLKEPKMFLSKVAELYKSNEKFLDTIQFKDDRIFERFSAPLLFGKENVGRVWSFRNITTRAEIEKLLVDGKAQDDAILSSIGDAVFACDVKGNILLFNPVAEEMTGISFNEAVNHHYNQVVNFVRESDGKPSNDFVRDAIKSNKITKMANHVLLVRKDGRKIPVADSAAPIIDAEGKIMGCVVVFHDVTKERKIDKAKTEFVSLASHQLRTPLSTINWYTEMLLSLDVGELTPKQRQYVQEVYHASQRMVNLVNALLNVSRLELGTFAIEPKMTNIVKLAKICIKELEPMMVKKKIKLTEKYDKRATYAMVDPKLKSIIFQNFLSNSIKYTPVGGKISFSISKEKDSMLIKVEDNGIGIPKDQQGEVFDKLFRADNAKKKDPDGSGLGLYIVKEIVDYTGGKVWFKSEEGKGTTFYASLPMSGMLKKSGTRELV